MVHRIILSADEHIVCPACNHGFELREGITRQMIERYEQEYDAALREERRRLEGEAAAEAERRLTRAFTAEKERLAESLTQRERELTEARARTEQMLAEAKSRAAADFELERRNLQQELAAKTQAVQALREQELALRKDKQALEEARAQMELDLARKLDEERRRLEEGIRSAEAQRFQLKEAEYQKKIADAQRANEDLSRKLEQGSQQLQGEVLELELEELLRSAFPLDEVEPVAKGRRGADVVQRVMGSNGQPCGTLIWEMKRAANWSEAWVQKLKDDQQAARADVAVLVTTAMPREIREPFAMHGGIWVATPAAMRPVAETLRVMLVELQRLKAANTGRQEKMALLYDYLASPHFAQKIRGVVESFAAMKRDLDGEKAAMQRLWKKREAQIERVTLNMAGMVGELQAIAQDSLPQLDALHALPAAEDADDDA